MIITLRNLDNGRKVLQIEATDPFNINEKDLIVYTEISEAQYDQILLGVATNAKPYNVNFIEHGTGKDTRIAEKFVKVS
jgi:hypothetical protein